MKIARPSYSNSTADIFVLKISRDELETLKLAYDEYLEFYKCKNLGDDKEPKTQTRKVRVTQCQ